MGNSIESASYNDVSSDYLNDIDNELANSTHFISNHAKNETNDPKTTKYQSSREKMDTNSEMLTYEEIDAMNKHSKWEEYSPFPSRLWPTQPFRINKHEFIAASSCSGRDHDIIYTFNKRKNEWNTILEHDANFLRSTTYDNVNQVIYFYSINEGQFTPTLMRFDVKTRTLSTVMEMSYHGPLIFAQNKLYMLHIDTLYVFDVIMKQFKKIHENPQVRYGNSEVIYLKSQKCLLVFGNTDPSQPVYAVYQFSFVDNKWSKLKVKIPTGLQIHEFVKCKHEQYLLLCGGWKDWKLSGDIFIYDTKTHLFAKSYTKCPQKCNYKYHGMTISDEKRDEILCFGFVKDCYKGNDFTNMQPLHVDLVQIVNCYFCYEVLHLFGSGIGSNLDGKRDHWEINIDDILQF